MVNPTRQWVLRGGFGKDQCNEGVPNQHDGHCPEKTGACCDKRKSEQRVKARHRAHIAVAERKIAKQAQNPLELRAVAQLLQARVVTVGLVGHCIIPLKHRTCFWRIDAEGQVICAELLCPQGDIGVAKPVRRGNHSAMTDFDADLPDASIEPTLVAQMIAHVGTAGFGAGLDRALRHVAPFDLSAVIAYSQGQRPVLLHDGLNDVSDAGAMQAYLEGTYLLDAVYTACKRQVAPGLYRLSDLAPDAFFEGEYYNSPHVHPCISLQSGALAEEVAYLIRFPSGPYATYSLMRTHGQIAFSAAEMAALAVYEPIVRAAILRNWDEAVPANRVVRAVDGGELEEAFRSFADDLLSPREQVIVSLVLRGHSSGSVGLNLGIAEGTVKNHRKHIYAKLEISSQAELFALFLRHLRKG